jgi:hypothetical protein
MSKFISFLKFLDLYGNTFQWRVANQSKYKSLSGGVFTILTLAIIILLTFTFGNDLFYRRNPKIYTEEGLYQDNEIPVLNGTEYPIKPVMLALPKAYTNVAKPRLYFSKGATAGNRYLDECTEAFVRQQFPEYDYTVGAKFLTFYCYNLNDNDLSYSTTMGVAIDQCRKMNATTLQYFRDRGIGCTVSDVTIPSTFVTMFTKQIGFQPDNALPFVNKTKIYRFSFQSVYSTYIRVNWDLRYLKDDVGWLTEDVDDSTDLQPQQEIVTQTAQVQVVPIPEFSINFFVSDSYRIHNRTYKKTQDVIANIGGFMQLVTVFLSTITSFLKVYDIDIYIINQRFNDVGQLSHKLEGKPNQSNIVVFNNSSMAGN